MVQDIRALSGVGAGASQAGFKADQRDEAG
jgi:hypothetical protein